MNEQKVRENHITISAKDQSFKYVFPESQTNESTGKGVPSKFCFYAFFWYGKNAIKMLKFYG